MKYKHKRHNWTAIKNKYNRYEIYIDGACMEFISEKFIEDSKDWEKVEECLFPVGTRFLTPGHKIIYTIKSIDEDNVKVSWGEKSSSDYELKNVNKFIKAREWVEYKEEKLEVPIGTEFTIGEFSAKIDKIENGNVFITSNNYVSTRARSIKEVNNNFKYGNWKVKQEELCVPIGTKLKIRKDGKFVYDTRMKEGRVELYTNNCILTTLSIPEINERIKNRVLIEYKEPTFTTEDGVKVKEGDTAWYIYSSTGNITDIVLTKSNIENRRTYTGKFFSTEELAKEYVNLNKKQFSINDIKLAIGERFGKLFNIDNLIENLKKL